MADPTVRRISSGVNGPLLHALADQAQYHDKGAVELFRTGAPVVGILDRCLPYLCVLGGSTCAVRVMIRAGIGNPIEPDVQTSIDELRQQREAKNRALIASLKEDSYSGHLLESCREDAKKGWMEPVRVANQCDLSNITLSPRFAVVQGK